MVDFPLKGSFCIFYPASRSCAAHGPRDWPVLETSGRVASGVAEYAQKIDPINHGWGQVEGKAMSEMLIYIFHPVVQHYLWHLSGVVPFSYIQGYAHTGKMDWTSSQCTQILDSFTVSWCFWRFQPRALAIMKAPELLGHCCKVNWICRERILPCCRWACRGLSSSYMARFGPNQTLHTSISHHFFCFLIRFV